MPSISLFFTTFDTVTTYCVSKRCSVGLILLFLFTEYRRAHYTVGLNLLWRIFLFHTTVFPNFKDKTGLFACFHRSESADFTCETNKNASEYSFLSKYFQKEPNIN
jgi:hypothetical protein